MSPSPHAELRHELVFDRQLDAAHAARTLRQQHFDVEGEQRLRGWRLLVRAQMNRYDETTAVRVLESVGAQCGGRYAGADVAQLD